MPLAFGALSKPAAPRLMYARVRLSAHGSASQSALGADRRARAGRHESVRAALGGESGGESGGARIDSRPGSAQLEAHHDALPPPVFRLVRALHDWCSGLSDSACDRLLSWLSRTTSSAASCLAPSIFGTTHTRALIL
eukprot:2224477-Pleurochrysis_carterae.AAC.1